jgi:hypothetical protein
VVLYYIKESTQKNLYRACRAGKGEKHTRKQTNYTRKERKKKTLDYHDSFCLPGGGLPE